MQVRITIHWPGGGEYEASVDADDPVLDDIGVTEKDREEMSRGGSITKSVGSNPAQLNLAQHLLDTATAISRVYLAGLEHDERLEAGRI